jgi:SMC interacting uncharacterized protein involved in chromosome segregation
MKAKNNRAPAPVPRLSQARSQTKKPRVAGLQRLAHQIVNQLTVINLSCFKLRTTLKNNAPFVNADIQRLEKAVTDMNVLVETLSQLEEHSAATSIAANPKATVIANNKADNVYPLFETKETGR